MIVFHNPGVINLNAALTLGVSVKEGDSPIGFFGTGLKFAIATILRNGGSVVLWRGADKHEFTVEATMIRGQEFNMITMDGERLGFTTMLGRNWEPWMAFRELASNCRDEGGRYFRSDATGAICAEHAEGNTTIIVAGLDDIWDQRASILLESEPLAVNEHLQVHSGGSPYIFYRGVRAASPIRSLAYTYSLLGDHQLTEDRTLGNPWATDQALVRGICALEDRTLLRRILTVGKEYHEGHLDFETWLPGDVGPAFAEVAEEIALGPSFVIGVAESLRQWARERALGRLDGAAQNTIRLSPARQTMLDRAKSMLAQAGYEIEDFPIIYTDLMGAGRYGCARDGKIYISALPFEKGTREVAATLFEEYAHLKSGQGDETRNFQQWLIDQIMVRVEEAAGEPF